MLLTGVLFVFTLAGFGVVYLRLSTLKGEFMTTVADLSTKIEAIKATIAAEKVEVQGKIQVLTDEVTRLTALLAAGGSVTAADLDGLMAGLQDLTTGVQGISEPEAAPVVAPVVGDQAVADEV